MRSVNVLRCAASGIDETKWVGEEWTQHLRLAHLDVKIFEPTDRFISTSHIDEILAYGTFLDTTQREARLRSRAGVPSCGSRVGRRDGRLAGGCAYVSQVPLGARTGSVEANRVGWSKAMHR